MEYTLNVTLKGKKKFGSSKKWHSTLIIRVELSRRAIGARLETMAIANANIPKSNHMVMVYSYYEPSDSSSNILVSSSQDIPTTTSHCTSHKGCCKFTPSKPPSFNDLSTKPSVAITAVPQWSDWSVGSANLRPTSASQEWKRSTSKLQRLEKRVWKVAWKSTGSSNENTVFEWTCR